MTETASRPILQGDKPAAADSGALRDRKELALIAVERTRMPMVVTDAQRDDNPIVLANQAFLDLTGYSAEEVIGHNCRFLQGPDTAEQDIELIRRGVADQVHNVTVELLNYRKDGSTFWNQLHISPVHDANDKLIYHFASQLDVSESRRAQALEEVERLLLLEVDHRSMNALALVNAMVQLSHSDSSSPAPASVAGRIDALARAHRSLAKARWRTLDLRAYLESEAAEMGGRVELEGPVVELAASQVQPFALVVHELMANAHRHGALAHDGGTVRIDWTLGPDGELLVHWRESGGVLKDVLPARGVGLQLVDGVVRRQLRGKALLNWRPDGLTAVLALPSEPYR